MRVSDENSFSYSLHAREVSQMGTEKVTNALVERLERRKRQESQDVDLGHEINFTLTGIGEVSDFRYRLTISTSTLDEPWSPVIFLDVPSVFESVTVDKSEYQEGIVALEFKLKKPLAHHYFTVFPESNVVFCSIYTTQSADDPPEDLHWVCELCGDEFHIRKPGE